MIPGRIAALVLAVASCTALAWGATVPLDAGLAVVTTFHGGLTSARERLGLADTEQVYSIGRNLPDAVQFDITIGAANDAKAAALMEQSPKTMTRVVRREDLAGSTRLSIMLSSTDPEQLPGRTFLTTSSAVLAALKGAGETPFVLGINETGTLAGFGGLGNALAANASTANDKADPRAAQLASGVGSFFNSAERHYYRGTLHRLEPAAVPFSVLLNGVRTTVPAVHAGGQLKFAEKILTTEFYWLDDPADPLTLKWSIGNAGMEAHELVTRIDNSDAGGTADSAGAGRGHMPAIDSGLGGRACHAELHGIYFVTGSAQLLPPSKPTLQALAALIDANPSWSVTIEGHTDNIGSAEYNLELSTRRANAVRQALIADYHVAEGRLAAKGYGLSRPVESNTTEEGRAHNRRVEVARKCS